MPKVLSESILAIKEFQKIFTSVFGEDAKPHQRFMYEEQIRAG